MIINKLILMSMFLSTLYLAGCATHLSQEQCQMLDMAQQGELDGNQGKAINTVFKYKKDCSEYHLKIDKIRYEQGWHIGNQSYCQPSGAFNLGKNGQSFPGVCVDNQQQILHHEYTRGRDIYQQIVMFKVRIDRIDEQLNRVEHLNYELDSINSDIAEAHREIKFQGKDSLDFRDHKDKLRSLKDRRDIIKAEIVASELTDAEHEPELEAQRDVLEQHVTRLQETT